MPGQSSDANTAINNPCSYKYMYDTRRHTSQLGDMKYNVNFFMNKSIMEEKGKVPHAQGHIVLLNQYHARTTIK